MVEVSGASSRTKTLVSAVVAVAICLVLTACGPSPQEQRRTALADYVAAEQATLPGVIDAASGLYTEVTVSGHFVAADHGDMSKAVVKFTYKYGSSVEFDTKVPAPQGAPPRPSFLAPLRPYSELLAMKAQIQVLCQGTVIPAMQQRGVTGPVRIEYEYLQPFGNVSWDAFCESNGA